MSHTPGPWTVDWLDDGNGWVLDKKGNYLCEIVTSDEEGKVVSAEKQVANARLMGAAPDLLEACNLAMERLAPKGNIKKDFDGHLAMAALSRAINQAKGGK